MFGGVMFNVGGVGKGVFAHNNAGFCGSALYVGA